MVPSYGQINKTVSEYQINEYLKFERAGIIHNAMNVMSWFSV